MSTSQVHTHGWRNTYDTKFTQQVQDIPIEKRYIHPIIQLDLEIVRWLVEVCASIPAIAYPVRALTSRCRTRDISIILWLVFFIISTDLGFPYFWNCTINLLFVCTLQYYLQCLRPIDLDPILLEIRATGSTDSDDTYGFPCIDTYMAIVVLKPVVEHTLASKAISVLCICIISLISFLKLATANRSFIQILGSWCTGYAGFYIGKLACKLILAYKLPQSYNTLAFVLLITFVMAVLGSWMEENQSYVVGIPKQDFVDVLANILGSDGYPTISDPDQIQSSILAPQSTPDTIGEEDIDDHRKSTVHKRDSFYFLMKRMKDRANAKQKQ